MSRFVLDSHALLVDYWREPGHLRVQQLLSSRTDECWMSVVNLGEMFYRIVREEGLESAARAMLATGRYPIHIVDADWRMTLGAALLKARYAMSYADCFAAALAQDLGATVVTGDREFEQIERAGIVAVAWLPLRGR